MGLLTSAQPNKQGSAGFTLIELIVALAILGVVLTGVVKMFSQSGRQQTGQEMLVTTTQDLRAAKMLMAQELREAGLNPQQADGIGFQTDSDDKYNTDTNSIHFTRDIVKVDGGGNSLDGYDGKTNGSNENIRYYRTNDDCSSAGAGPILNAGDTTPGCLRRDPGTGGQVVMPNVTNLQFVYYDKDNTVIDPATLSKRTAREKIRTVEVTLTGQVESPNRVTAAAATQTLQFRVLVRNS